MGSVIAASIPGRLRLRMPELRDLSCNSRLSSEIGEWEGVVAVESKPGSGSIIINYDISLLAQGELEVRLAQRLVTTVHEVEEFNLWYLNLPAKIGMLGSLGLALLSLGFSKKLHAVMGGLYIGFLLLHLANHRQRIGQ